MRRGFWSSLITAIEAVVFIVLLLLWNPKSLQWIISVIALFVILSLKLLVWVLERVSQNK